MMKRLILMAWLITCCAIQPQAQDLAHYKRIVKELSSAGYQGRGYAKGGANKAGRFLLKEYQKAGVDEVAVQPFTIDINTFPGKMEMWADGRKLQAGVDFSMREYSPGIHGEFPVYHVDTLDFDPDRLFADLAKPENEGCLVACDFWFTYRHRDVFARLQKAGACPNAGFLYLWPSPIKFFKAYGEKVVDKPIIWVTPEAIAGVKSVRVNVDNQFLKGYELFNVIAKVTGERHDSCYVFTAHYDHLGNLGQNIYYAGANDNASGSAAIVTLAAHYAKHRPQYDMYFVAFSGEDANLRGSQFFVNNPIVPLSQIKYLFNIDMIGDDNPVLYCEVSDEGMAGFSLFEQINQEKSYFTALNRGALAANSDHYPFAIRHVPCIFLENENGSAFPYYHTIYDNWQHAVFNSYEPVFRLVADFIEKDAAHAEEVEEPYWTLNAEGGITWNYDGRAHTDHVEMAGRQMAVVLHYGVTPTGRFTCERHLVFPMLRTIPNDTHASFIRYVNWEPLESVLIGQRRLVDSQERVETVSLKGLMTVESRWGTIGVRRTLCPSPTQPALMEQYELTNLGERAVAVRIEPTEHRITSDASKGVDGAYVVEETLAGTGSFRLEPQQSLTFSAILSARRESEQPLTCDVAAEIAARRKQVEQWQQNLVLETPDSVLNRMFAFAKIRACESIYETKNGPMHGPGGERYYAAIWANDQAEYANPFFPFIGDAYANASAMNSWKMFAAWMNDEWKPIPSSIIAEGTDYWNGAGDRGDAAMIAYGAARYALARGDRSEAEQLWPLIQWTLEYCRRQLNEAGVVHSDRDELEGRFPSGNANLCTSSLYYDALLSAAYLARDLKQPAAISKSYERQAHDLRTAIDRYFHAEVEGFDTYRYYDGNTVLRSWICIPLTMGIFERAQGTIDALFSPRLWTKDGMLTQAGSETFWDRSTLYALRGALMAGDTERTLPFLQYYSRTRLLGSHVPYAIEAWPEGNQRHLSAESALYARIITEGLFGIRPTGLHHFTASPRLPEAWPEMTLRHLRICGDDCDLRVYRDSKRQVRVQLIRNGTVIKEQKDMLR